jgi:hypothetical protein
MTSELAYQLKRVARHLIWPHPWLYFPFGIVRHGMFANVLARKHAIYICGYPRSGNWFAVKAFLLANPGVSVHSHRHIPTFIVASLQRRIRGIVLIRNPLDAAISWSLFMNRPLHRALQYYVDYYSVLLPYRDQLFIARFEDVTADFGRVTLAFNAHSATAYTCFNHSPKNVALCLSQIDAMFRRRDGSIDEFRVSRPSQARNARKQALVAEALNSPKAQDALRQAQSVYDLFSQTAHRNDLSPTHKPTPAPGLKSHNPRICAA